MHVYTFSSFQSLDCLGRRAGGGGGEGRFSRDPLPDFSAGDHCEQFWHGQGCPLFDVVHRAFPLPTTAWPTHTTCPEGWVGEAVVVSSLAGALSPVDHQGL